MKSVFSVRLWWQGIKKIRVPGIAMAVATVVLNLLNPLMSAASDRLSRSDAYTGQFDVSAYGAAPLSILIPIFAPLLVWCMFSYLNDRGKSDFYHSVPQTRLCVYSSFMLSVLTWVVGVLLLTTGLNLALWPLARFHVLDVGGTLLAALSILVCSLFSMAVMALAMTVTGTTVSNLFVALIIAILPRICSFMYVEFVSELARVWAYSYQPMVNIFANIETYFPWVIFYNTIDGDLGIFSESYGGWLMVYYTVVSLGMLALGGWLYHLRRSEMATKSAPGRKWQHAFRIAVTLPFFIFVFIQSYCDGLDGDYLWLLLIAVVVYILFELATTRRLKAMLRSLPLLLIPVALSGLFLAVGKLHASAIQADTPGADRIEAVYLLDNFSEGYTDALVGEIALTDEESIRIAAEALQRSAPLSGTNYARTEELIDAGYSYSANIRIELKSGRSLCRWVRLSETQWMTLRANHRNAPEYTEELLLLPSLDEITYVMMELGDVSTRDWSSKESQAWQLYLSEFASLTTEQKKEVLLTEEVQLCLRISGRSRGRYFYQRYAVSPAYMPKTTAYMLEWVNQDFDGREPYDQVQQTVSLFENNADIFFSEKETLAGTGSSVSLMVTDFVLWDDGRSSGRSRPLAVGNSDKDFQRAYELLMLMQENPQWFDVPETAAEYQNARLYQIEFYCDHTGGKLSSNFLCYVILTEEEAKELLGVTSLTWDED